MKLNTILYLTQLVKSSIETPGLEEWPDKSLFGKSSPKSGKVRKKLNKNTCGSAI